MHPLSIPTLPQSTVTFPKPPFSDPQGTSPSRPGSTPRPPGGPARSSPPPAPTQNPLPALDHLQEGWGVRLGQVPQVLFLDGVCVAVARSSRKPNMAGRGAKGGGGGRTGVTGGPGGAGSDAGGVWGGLGPDCTRKTHLCPPTDGTLWSDGSGRSDHQKRLRRPPTGAGSVAVVLRRPPLGRSGLQGPARGVGWVRCLR